MVDGRLNPPVVDNKTKAQCKGISTSSPIIISIPFLMNKSVGWSQFDFIALELKTVQSNTILSSKFFFCLKESLVLSDGKYWAYFDISSLEDTLKIGQHYKAQLAYGLGNPTSINTCTLGFWSNVTTFKYTAMPSLSIQKLDDSKENIHFYNYTGVYTNTGDPSEKVYSYEFKLYNSSNKLVATSGELLHNSSSDTDTTSSTDSWTTRQGLEQNKWYILVYTVKTVNGLEVTSPSYRLIDNQTIPSTLFDYCNFVATPNLDSAYIELSLQPKSNITQENRKFISGQFVLLRSSNEDNFNAWHKLTEFVLASHDTAVKKFICNDYCVSQGVVYRYALQAFNSEGLYSLREETKDVLMDFEDMFLSDGNRQLKIRFNPKVSSFKNTILESKMDTIGGKYPFFFRNGNVKYKEFPISGLISMLMDDNEEFMRGIQITSTKRTKTPAAASDAKDLPTALTGDNFRRERDFKLEVLDWLTNGQPKHFRSPGEGSYIVRLMNTSLSPTDSLSRMLHTFSCTAYEIADYTFENLRKYGMLMDEYLEIRELKILPVELHNIETGVVSNLNASTATLHAPPGLKFLYKLAGDRDPVEMSIGATGVFEFPKSVLAETPLQWISPPGNDPKGSYWLPGATLIYGQYLNYEVEDFSYIHSISITDKIAQWIGRDRNEIDFRLDEKKILKSVGMVYYLNISKRPIVISLSDVVPNGDGTYTFKEGNVIYHPGNNELIFFEGNYYDGETRRLIGPEVDFSFKLRADDIPIDMQGVSDLTSDIGDVLGCDSITSTGGRIIMSNVSDVDALYMGRGVYADIAYQEIHKTYSIEFVVGSDVKDAKDRYEDNKTPSNWEAYYEALDTYLQSQGGLIINAI